MATGVGDTIITRSAGSGHSSPAVRTFTENFGGVKTCEVAPEAVYSSLLERRNWRDQRQARREDSPDRRGGCGMVVLTASKLSSRTELSIV